MMRILCWCMLTLLLVASPVQADGLFQKLPEDGTWVRYYLKMTAFSPDGGKLAHIGNGTLIIALVGEETVKEERCRWLEYRFDFESGDFGGQHLVKFLVPEQAILRGESPERCALKIWNRLGDEEATSVSALIPDGNALVSLLAFRQLDEVQKLEPVEILHPLGLLKCEVHEGVNSYKLDGSTVDYKQIVRKHDSLPFGVVSSSILMRIESPDGKSAEISLSLMLEESGTEAKSELPGYRWEKPHPEGVPKYLPPPVKPLPQFSRPKPFPEEID